MQHYVLTSAPSIEICERACPIEIHLLDAPQPVLKNAVSRPHRNVNASVAVLLRLAVVLGRYLAGRLVIWLFPHESALYPQVVHSSFFGVPAVVLVGKVVHISKDCQALWPVLELLSGCSIVSIMIMLDNMNFPPFSEVSPGMTFNLDFRKQFIRF